MGKALAPWTDEQVRALHDWQDCGWVHEFTCRDGHKLVPTRNGWICSQRFCHHRQNWALDFMLKGPPPNPIEETLEKIRRLRAEAPDHG